jgi:hypothetical protein
MKKLLNISVFILIILASWEITLRSISLPNVSIPNVFERNINRAEKIMLKSENDFSIFLAGSSTTADIDMSIFGDHAYEFSIEGGGSITSLSYLNENHISPEIVLVETNSVLREKDEELLKSLRNPFKNVLRKNFKSFRMIHKPSRYLVYVLNKLSDYLNYNFFHFNLHKGNLNQEYLTDKVISDHINKNNTLKDTIIIKDKIMSLFNEVKLLQENGSRVMFFEIPFDRRINNTRVPKYIDSIFEYISKQKRISYFPIDREKKYITSDGIHLQSNERKNYMLELKSKLSN